MHTAALYIISWIHVFSPHPLQVTCVAAGERHGKIATIKERPFSSSLALLDTYLVNFSVSKMCLLVKKDCISSALNEGSSTIQTNTHFVSSGWWNDGANTQQSQDHLWRTPAAYTSDSTTLPTPTKTMSAFTREDLTHSLEKSFDQ